MWLRADVPALCIESTAENYRGFLNKHILPVFGNLKVTEINRGKVKNFMLERVGSGYSKSYAGRLRNVISGVSNQLGHHSVKFTMNIYCYWFPGKNKSEVDGLDDPAFTHLSASRDSKILITH
jgi:hypothetical protein